MGGKHILEILDNKGKILGQDCKVGVGLQAGDGPGRGAEGVKTMLSTN